MPAEPGDYVIGAMMAVSAVIGLLLAGNALDLEMQIFGLSLVGFSIAFVFGQIHRHFAAVQRAAVLARKGRAP